MTQLPERYDGQDIVESIGTIVVLILILAGITLMFLWEPDKPATIDQPLNVTITPNVTIATPEPTPTPIPETYQEFKYRTNQYNMSEWVQWQRENVSGYKDMDVKFTAYRIKEMDSYKTWEVSWGYDWINVPAPGNKFVFVWICGYMNGLTQEKDPSMWGFEPNHFVLRTNKADYIEQNSKVDLTAPIREFNYVYDLENTTITEPYGVYRTQQQPSGKIQTWPIGWMRMETPYQSHAWDGWILYEVPKDETVKEIHADFAHLGGQVHWSIEPGGGFFK